MNSRARREFGKSYAGYCEAMAAAWKRRRWWLRQVHNMPNADFQIGCAWFKAWEDHGKSLKHNYRRGK